MVKVGIEPMCFGDVDGFRRTLEIKLYRCVPQIMITGIAKSCSQVIDLSPEDAQALSDWLKAYVRMKPLLPGAP